MKVTAVILAGGYGRRFQTDNRWIDKLLVEVQGKPLLQHVVDAAKDLVDDLVVVTKKDRVRKYSELLTNVKILYDKPPIKISSPILGISTAAREIESDYYIILAGDMPYINSEVLNYLISNINGFDVVTPIWPNGAVEPLLSIYSTKVMRKIDVIMEKPRIRSTDLIRAGYKIKFIPLHAIKEVDPNLKSLININTKNDLKTNKIDIGAEGNIIETLTLMFDDDHFYWKALDQYLESDFDNAFKSYLDEAEIYHRHSIEHLRLHSLLDAVNISRLLGRDVNEMVKEITQIEAKIIRR